MSERGHLKGSMFLSTFAFLEERFGPEAKERLLDALEPEDRALLDGIVLPITTYPLATFVRLLHAMDHVFGQGDRALIFERGQWAASRDLHTLRKIVLKLVTIPWLVTKASALWPQFHDSGHWEVHQTGPKTATAELRDLAIVDDALCASIGGWVSGLCSLTGSRAIVTHSACRGHGAPACVYDVRWE
jgi:hypothetical protein